MEMKNILKKGAVIAKAFLNELPIDQEWYQDRVSKCSPCEYNSDNIPSEKLSFTDKLKIKTGLCGDGPHCTACGCCIRQKSASKTETCGRIEIGLTPLWEALEVSDSSGEYTIIQTSSDHKVKNTNKEFLYDLGVTDQNTVKLSFNILSKKPQKINKTTVGCGCTHVDVITPINKSENKLDVTISTIGFRQGLNEKTLNIEYKVTERVFKTVTVRFRIIKL